MEIEKLVSAIIFMIIGAVIFIVLLPTIFTTLSPVVQNTTYVKLFGSTIDILEILPLIISAIVIVFFVKMFRE